MAACSRCAGALAIDRRQDDEAGVQLDAADQPAEVAGVFRDDDAILGDAQGQNKMVRFAAASDMQRVNRVMKSRLVEAQGQLRRQALIDEQPHAAWAHGRPAGRPISGCVRA